MSWQKPDLRILGDLCTPSLDHGFTARAKPNPAVELRSLLQEVIVRIILTTRCANSVIDVDRGSRFEFRCGRRGGLRRSGIANMSVLQSHYLTDRCETSGDVHSVANLIYARSKVGAVLGSYDAKRDASCNC